MDKLRECPFCGGEAAVCDIKEPSVNGWVGCQRCRCFMDFVKNGKSLAIAAWNRRAQPAELPCYLPEQNNPYPLCVGRGMAACAHCCIWADYEPEEDESRVNRALTLDELRGQNGQGG